MQVLCVILGLVIADSSIWTPEIVAEKFSVEKFKKRDMATEEQCGRWNL